MNTEQIKSEVGLVVNQLLNYDYQEIPLEHYTEGQKKAFVSSKQWLESVFVAEFQPKMNVVEMIHRRDKNTCDATLVKYEVDGYEIQVSQTIFIISILVVSKNTPSTKDGDIEQMVTSLAQKLFQYPERLKLTVKSKKNGVSFGNQTIEKGKISKEHDWLDTIRWWSDGKQISFIMLKLIPYQAAVISTDLNPNQIWFERFEKKRTR
jgi:hypothetical protein